MSAGKHTNLLQHCTGLFPAWIRRLSAQRSAWTLLHYSMDLELRVLYLPIFIFADLQQLTGS